MSKIQNEKINLRLESANSKFDEVLRFANKYKNIPEVQTVIGELQGTYENYEQEAETIINREQTLVDENYAVYDACVGKKMWWQLALVVFVILFFFANVANVGVLFLLSVFGILVCGVGLIIYIVKGKFLFQKYEKVANASSEVVRQFNIKYTRELDSLYDKIDWMYLNSLDPAHRETILMRRDQERQHQERMQLMQKQHEEQMRLQRENMQRAEAERRQMMDAQNELLSIEKEREDRYWRNR